MRVATLYDIHGNLPALEAVLAEVRAANVDLIVVGGDVVPGPMPREVLELLNAFDIPKRWIHGNCERSILAQMEAIDSGVVTYWGTASGNPLPEADRRVMRWTAEQLRSDYESIFGAWPRTLRFAIEGIGDVLFCHATPRSEVEIFTRLTPAERLLPIFDPLDASLVVCGHTHMQVDRTIGKTRVINSGSVGMPIGKSGAFWTLLGPGVELRRTPYDLEAAAERIRATPFPGAAKTAADLLTPPEEETVIAMFEKASLK